MDEYKDCNSFLPILLLRTLEHDSPNPLLRFLSHANRGQILLHPTVPLVEMINDSLDKLSRPS
jgi:hypothetical protein